jgi:cell division protein FtsB
MRRSGTAGGLKEARMEVFTMVVLIVLIASAAGVANNYLKNRRLAMRNGGNGQVAAELEELRRRVETLEAIVTEEKYHLEREINRLERQA